MRINNQVHFIRKEFDVTPEVKRYVNIYLIEGDISYAFPSGSHRCSSRNTKADEFYKRAELLHFSGNPLVTKSIEACRKK